MGRHQLLKSIQADIKISTRLKTDQQYGKICQRLYPLAAIKQIRFAPTLTLL
ncbi:MAG: hypothetical protein HOO93_14180 [Methyloglobulus sp.]|nr:hypothetical protein [Methyloglobulus sp.]